MTILSAMTGHEGTGEGRLPSTLIRFSGSVDLGVPLPEYDEVDRRLMDTFPASDAVGRY